MDMTNMQANLTDEQKMAMNIISLNTAVNELQDDLKTINKIVRIGNGELPLVEQVRNHDAYIKNIQYWGRFIGGALIIQTIAFGVGTAIAVVQFLPLLTKLVANQP